MGELLRSRVLRALGLANIWVQLEALSTRLKRVEVGLDLLSGEAGPRTRPQTLRAAPPPPAAGEPGGWGPSGESEAYAALLAARRDGGKS